MKRRMKSKSGRGSNGHVRCQELSASYHTESISKFLSQIVFENLPEDCSPRRVRSRDSPSPKMCGNLLQTQTAIDDQFTPNGEGRFIRCQENDSAGYLRRCAEAFGG